jgi:REP element-mobilizing transposase RayT
MARAWRIAFEGALYHVWSRGNERRDIFFGDEDRRRFLDALGDMAQRFEMDVFAYVLMGNHYHLLLRTARANLSRAMQWLGVTYTNRFNAKHLRSGHLYQGRFKSMLVQNDAYLLQLSYYIHRNPLRAKMVERLADYRWSSYRTYAYGQKAMGWLNTERILSQLVNAPGRHQAYRENTQKYAKEESRADFLEPGIRPRFAALCHLAARGSDQFTDRGDLWDERVCGQQAHGRIEFQSCR